MCFVHKFENNDSSPDWAGLNSSSVYLTQPMAPLLTFKGHLLSDHQIHLAATLLETAGAFSCLERSGVRKKVGGKQEPGALREMWSKHLRQPFSSGEG